MHNFEQEPLIVRDFEEDHMKRFPVWGLIVYALVYLALLFAGVMWLTSPARSAEPEYGPTEMVAIQAVGVWFAENKCGIRVRDDYKAAIAAAIKQSDPDMVVTYVDKWVNNALATEVRDGLRGMCRGYFNLLSEANLLAVKEGVR